MHKKTEISLAVQTPDLADDDVKLKSKAGIVAISLDACEKESRPECDLQGSLKRRGTRTFTIKVSIQYRYGYNWY